MVTLGLALNYQGKVGYFKPFKEMLMNDAEKLVDQDAFLMKKALRLRCDEERLSPFLYDVLRPMKMSAIVEAFDHVKGESELMLVEGTRDITSGFLQDVSGMAIAEALHAEIVLVSSATPSALDRIALLTQLMRSYKVVFKGVVLNMCDSPHPKAVLEDKGIKVLGVLPVSPELKRFTVREVADAMSAEVIVEDGLDNIVEDVMVGAMTPETAIKYLRRVARKALITGGDRADIQMAALETDTSCLVLTGGLHPAKQVIAKAYQKGVPILLTQYDTLYASEMIDHLIARIDPDDQAKIERIKGLVRDHVVLDEIWG
jgi:BioD-like phosphotransacetylase family protein